MLMLFYKFLLLPLALEPMDVIPISFKSLSMISFIMRTTYKLVC